MVSFARITVLSWADLFANYATWVMMTYLTDVWQLSSTRAAGILNIWNGISKTLPIIFALFLGSLGNFRVLLISSIAYTIGLGLLTISTPSVSGPCSESKSSCIGYKQKVLFYTSLALISVGIAGHFVSLKPFMDEQTEEANDDNEEDTKNEPPTTKEQTKNEQDSKTEQVENAPRQKPAEDEHKVLYQTLGVIIVVIVSIGGGVALQYIKPWSLRFGLPAIFTLVSTLVFSTIIFSKSYNLSTQRIEATMIGLKMIPVLLTFIICGLVLSVGNTYFLEQANTMSRKLGSIKVPLSILLLFYNFMKSIFQAIYISSAYTTSPTSSEDLPNEGGDGEAPAAEKKELRTYAPAVWIGVAMTFSILCCITAARIEKQRLHVIRNHGLEDKPDETVPMTVFKLFPQFMLLAAFDGIFGKCTVDFFIGQGLEHLSNIFIGGMSGVGVMSSVLAVYAVGKVSASGGKPNWFQDSLSKSRLDRYYWTLAALSAVNLVVYIVVARYCYSYKKAEAGDGEGEEGEGPAMPNEDNAET